VKIWNNFNFLWIFSIYEESKNSFVLSFSFLVYIKKSICSKIQKKTKALVGRVCTFLKLVARLCKINFLITQFFSLTPKKTQLLNKRTENWYLLIEFKVFSFDKVFLSKVPDKFRFSKFWACSSMKKCKKHLGSKFQI